MGGILPLSESTFNLYPELRGRIDINSDNKDLICNIIKNRIDRFNNDIEKSIKLGLEFLENNEIEFRGKCDGN